jgi:glycosyltransferase involved in cell wall biosynthesis
MTPRAFVVEAYIPNGGTLMAYHLARILHQDFGFDAIVAGGHAPDHGIFDYDPVFPMMPIEDLVGAVTDDDILIANPSFSDHLFGLRCRGRKIMYVQGFNTFQLLDCRFDLYVCVSPFVRDFIRNTYGIATEVIPPFIRREAFGPAPAWTDRPPGSIGVMLKGDPAQQGLWLETLRDLLRHRRPQADLDVISNAKVRQADFVQSIARRRHFLSLSPAEGFGLAPLEAMATGTTVLGFDAFGGRDYMRPRSNCAVVPYPRVEALAEEIVEVLENPAYGAALAQAGFETAASERYSHAAFRTAWRATFDAFLNRDRP